MPRPRRTIVVGERELQIVVDRLSAIHGLRRHAEYPGEAERRLGATWCIGETLAACGGYELMWLVYQMTEESCGPECARWLDQMWDGVTVTGVVLWVAHS